MRKNQDIIPDFDDILFESRNKEYGAYQLRKKYNRAVITGILISTLIVCAAVIIPALKNNSKEYNIAGSGKFVQVEMEKLPPPEELIYIPPPSPPEKTEPHEIEKYVAPVIIDSIVPLNQSPMITDEALIQGPVTDQESYSNGSGDELLAGEGSVGDGEAFFMVEEMPTFKGGGLDKFREWIYKHTNYPQEAVDAKIRGKVTLTFVVEKDGSVTHVEIVKSVHPLLDNEAVKVISESPKWAPGLQRGQPVRVRYVIPLTFML
jgi:periplasmic protein TonB